MSQSLPTEIKTKNILKFVFPTIIMIVFSGLYTMVDGLFVSNFVGTDALAAVNIVFPFISIAIGIGIMLGTGGSAIVAKSLGKNEPECAKKEFSLIVLAGILTGIIIMIPVAIWLDECIILLGATDRLFVHGKGYMQMIVYAAPFSILALIFQSFFVTAARPVLGLALSAMGGVLNILLDYIFVGVVGMGTFGAGLATAIGNSVPGLVGLIYFVFKRNGLICITRPAKSMKVLLKAAFNGSSEMVTNLAAAVTTFLFNYQMMKYAGEDGVAAITTALYLQFLLTTVFIGYAIGIAPVFSFLYGQKNNDATRKLFKISIVFVAINSVLWFGIAMLAHHPLIAVFTKEGVVYEIAKNGWFLFAPMFLIAGFNIFASALFTAFSDGIRSAIISFLRTFVLLVTFIMLLPEFLGEKGIWLAVPVAELMTLAVSVWLMSAKGKFYHFTGKPSDDFPAYVYERERCIPCENKDETKLNANDSDVLSTTESA